MIYSFINTETIKKKLKYIFLQKESRSWLIFLAKAVGDSSAW